MNRVKQKSQPNRGGGGKRPPQQMVQGTNDCTSQQLSMLLTTANSLTTFVVEGALRDPANLSESMHLDGGVVAGAAGTILKVFDRIDKIIEDEDRWGAKNNRQAEEDVNAGAKKQRELMEYQADMISRPSTQLRPVVGYNPEKNCWVALLENNHTGLIPVHGYGATPEEALKAFDDTFRGLKPHIEKRVAEAKKEAEAELARKRNPKQGGGIMIPAYLRDEMERLHKTAQEAEEERKRSKEANDETEGKQ